MTDENKLTENDGGIFVRMVERILPRFITQHPLFVKFRDLIPYGFFGVLTTIVNIFSYWVCSHLLGIPTLPSTFIAWFLGVVFAFFTNRKWVFYSKAKGFWAIAKEGVSFTAARIATGLVDLLCMFIFVDVLHLNDMWVKTLANILVIMLNYIFSKFIVFRKK